MFQPSSEFLHETCFFRRGIDKTHLAKVICNAQSSFALILCMHPICDLISFLSSSSLYSFEIDCAIKFCESWCTPAYLKVQLMKRKRYYRILTKLCIFFFFFKVWWFPITTTGETTTTIITMASISLLFYVNLFFFISRLHLACGC